MRDGSTCRCAGPDSLGHSPWSRRRGPRRAGLRCPRAALRAELERLEGSVPEAAFSPRRTVFSPPPNLSHPLSPRPFAVFQKKAQPKLGVCGHLSRIRSHALRSLFASLRSKAPPGSCCWAPSAAAGAVQRCPAAGDAFQGTRSPVGSVLVLLSLSGAGQALAPRSPLPPDVSPAPLLQASAILLTAAPGAGTCPRLVPPSHPLFPIQPTALALSSEPIPGLSPVTTQLQPPLPSAGGRPLRPSAPVTLPVVRHRRQTSSS